jgi:hypothetical protein
MSDKYYGICDANHLVTVGWMGDDRDTEEEAKKDCEKHIADTFPHKCEVQSKSH